MYLRVVYTILITGKGINLDPLSILTYWSGTRQFRRKHTSSSLSSPSQKLEPESISYCEDSTLKLFSLFTSTIMCLPFPPFSRNDFPSLLSTFPNLFLGLLFQVFSDYSECLTMDDVKNKTSSWNSFTFSKLVFCKYVLIYAEETSGCLLKGRFADPPSNPLVFITWKYACEVLISGIPIHTV